MKKKGNLMALRIGASVLAVLVIGGGFVFAFGGIVLPPPIWWPRPIHTTTTTTTTSTTGFPPATPNMAGEVWPMVLPGAGASIQSVDQPFILMLRQAGVGVCTFETDVPIFMAHESRFASDFAYCRSLGMKVQIINQFDPQFEIIDGIAPPCGMGCTLYQFTNLQTQGITEYMKYSPDLLSVIAEPGLYNSKIGLTASASDIANLVAQLSAQAKGINPFVQTWYDAVPCNGFDVNVAKALIGVVSLNGIGADLYGNCMSAASIAPYLFQIQNAGKLVGLTETWWEDIFANPTYDNPTYVNQASDWLSTSSTGAYSQLKNAGVTVSIFSPFFTNDFVTLDHLPTPFTQQSIYQESVTLLADLQAGQRTQVFTAYQGVTANP